MQSIAVLASVSAHGIAAFQAPLGAEVVLVVVHAAALDEEPRHELVGVQVVGQEQHHLPLTGGELAPGGGRRSGCGGGKMGYSYDKKG